MKRIPYTVVNSATLRKGNVFAFKSNRNHLYVVTANKGGVVHYEPAYDWLPLEGVAELTAHRDVCKTDVAQVPWLQEFLTPHHYRIITPGPGFRVKTFAEALRLAHSGLDSIAAKRGYSMTKGFAQDGTYRLSVFNSKGKRVTGAAIARVAGPAPGNRYSLSDTGKISRTFMGYGNYN